MKLNKETLGKNEPLFKEFYEEMFIEKIFYEISSSTRGVEAWSTNKFPNTQDYDTAEWSVFVSDEDSEDIYLNLDWYIALED